VAVEQNKRVSRFLIRTDVAMHPQRGHWCRTPHFVVKIFLTYKTVLPMLPPVKKEVLISLIWRLKFGAYKMTPSCSGPFYATILPFNIIYLPSYHP